MRPGDAVVLHTISDECLRLWDVPGNVFPNPGNPLRNVKYKHVVDKLYPKEIGVVVRLQDDLVQILSPRGVLGWSKSASVEVIGEAG